MRDEWRQDRIAILTQVHLSTIAALLSHLGLGCSTAGHSGPSPLQVSSHFGIPVSDWLTAAGTLSIFFLDSHLLPLFFGLFTQVLLLIDHSVEGQYITYIQYWRVYLLLFWHIKPVYVISWMYGKMHRHSWLYGRLVEVFSSPTFRKFLSILRGGGQPRCFSPFLRFSV